MPSFFEKLRSSMGVEEEEYEEQELKEEPKQKKGKKEDEEKSKKVRVKAPPAKQDEEQKVELTEEEQSPDWFEPEGELAVDVYQADGEIVIQSTIAGIKPEDLDISIENDVVTITGERKNQTEEKGKNYFYQECYWGAFSRQIILPEEVDPSRAEATMKEGVFTLRIPIVERKKIRKIKVRS